MTLEERITKSVENEKKTYLYGLFEAFEDAKKIIENIPYNEEKQINCNLIIVDFKNHRVGLAWIGNYINGTPEQVKSFWEWCQDEKRLYPIDNKKNYCMFATEIAEIKFKLGTKTKISVVCLQNNDFMHIDKDAKRSFIKNCVVPELEVYEGFESFNEETLELIFNLDFFK